MPRLMDDLLANAKRYQQNFQPEKTLQELSPMNKPVCVLCCMDHRVIPEKILGLDIGDAEVIRNGGGRDLCQCKLFIVIHHNDCGATRAGQMKEELMDMYKRRGIDISYINIPPMDDLDASIREDVEKLRKMPEMRNDVAIYGFAYDVNDGSLRQVVHDPATEGNEP